MLNTKIGKRTGLAAAILCCFSLNGASNSTYYETFFDTSCM